MQIDQLITATPLLLYFSAAVLYLHALLRGRDALQRIASAISMVGAGVQGIGMIFDGLAEHRLPSANLHESLAFAAWALMLIYLVMERRYRIAALGMFVNLTVLAVMAGIRVLPMGTGPIAPAMLQVRWSAIHIVSSLIALASFVLAFGAVLGYLLQEQMLKGKRISILQRHLPSLDMADRVSYMMVAFGFPMLTLGIVTGALWAQAAWGRYWNWDPKETWAFATWLVYAAYLHERMVVGRRGKWPNRLLIAGFCFAMFTLIGVNLLPTGLHRYN